MLTDKVTFVTGGGSGIGRATALAFARAGARAVVVSDVHDTEGAETIELITREGGRGPYIHADVSREDEVAGALDRVVATYGRLDVAFNNAGIEGVSLPVHEVSEADWDRVLDINLKGVWLCLKHEVRLMLPHRAGAIVNMSSIAGLVGFATSGPYVASKHAIIGLTKTAALELATSGIRVNAVCPGVIRTPMIDRAVARDAAMEAALTAMEPVGRLGRAEEVADAVVWLSSDAASFVTGHALVVDGGAVAR